MSDKNKNNNKIESIHIVSFGYKYGELIGPTTLLFDVRFLENPYRDINLRPLTGADPEIIEYLENQPETNAFAEHIAATIELMLPGYFTNRSAYGDLVFAFGCTGGKHRSRYYAIRFRAVVEEIVQRLGLEVSITLAHRDAGKE